MAVDAYREANRANWNSRAEIHYGSDTYGIAKRISDPDYLGCVVDFDKDKMPDVAGKRLLHLQCHIGTDTLGWARLGAEVTGIDLSDKSIDAARRLSGACRTPGRFIVSELYDAPEVLPETFDIVYTGVGALNWLPDIAGWAQVVSVFLRPGGVFYMREGHPIMWALDDERDDEELVIVHPYFEVPEPLEWNDESTYAGDAVLDSPRCFEWNHGMAETLQALIDAGLRIDRVEEYDALEWESPPVSVLGDDERFRLRQDRERLPVMWSVLATQTAGL